MVKEIQVAEVNEEEEERIRIALLPEVIDKRRLPAFMMLLIDAFVTNS